MANIIHKNYTTTTGIHIPYTFSYANSTAREAATGFVSGDVGKLALQEDNNTLWLLTATTPTWLSMNFESINDLSEKTSPVAGDKYLLANSESDYANTKIDNPWPPNVQGNHKAVLAGKTNDSTDLTTSWVAFDLDETAIETDSAVIEHNNVTISRIDIKEDGLYQLYYSTCMACWDSTPPGSGGLRITKNGDTEIPGSYHYIGNIPNGDRFLITVICYATLSNGDYVEVEGREIDGNYQVQTGSQGIKLQVIRWKKG